MLSNTGVMSSPLSFYFNESSLKGNELAKPVHCNGRHLRLVLHITIIAHRHTSHAQHRRINRDIYITYIKAYC